MKNKNMIDDMWEDILRFSGNHKGNRPSRELIQGIVKLVAEDCGKNLFLYGATGTGKTAAAMQWLRRRLSAEGSDDQPDWKWEDSGWYISLLTMNDRCDADQIKSDMSMHTCLVVDDWYPPIKPVITEALFLGLRDRCANESRDTILIAPCSLKAMALHGGHTKAFDGLVHLIRQHFVSVHFSTYVPSRATSVPGSKGVLPRFEEAAK